MEFKRETEMVENNRTLENPSARYGIRQDFPSIKIYRPDDAENSQRLLNVLKNELAKHGESLETVGSITIAYPHKHPDLFPGHKNRAAEHVEKFIQAMLDAAPDMKWLTADAICETRKLNRSKDQTSIHALTERQEYTLHSPSQKEALPFFDPAQRKTSFFVIVDDAVLQGTTVVNLMNFIEHNGGKVLMVSARESDDGVPIVPTKARLNEMGRAFSESARADGLSWPPEICLQKFEAAMKPHGVTLAAMTDGECVSLIKTMQGLDRREDTGPKVSFISILKQLDTTAPTMARPAAIRQNITKNNI